MLTLILCGVIAVLSLILHRFSIMGINHYFDNAMYIDIEPLNDENSKRLLEKQYRKEVTFLKVVITFVFLGILVCSGIIAYGVF
jgi:hypothetical protein